MLANAALYGPPTPRKGRGRPRLYGERELAPNQRFKCGGRWKTIKVRIYRRDVTLKVKTAVSRWRKVTGARPVRLILNRDPSGRMEDRAYFSTDLTASTNEILGRIARRWLIEVCFRGLKQHFGFGDAQNGW